MDNVNVNQTLLDGVANSALLVHLVSVLRAAHLANVTRLARWTTFATVRQASVDVVPTLTDAYVINVNLDFGKLNLIFLQFKQNINFISIRTGISHLVNVASATATPTFVTLELAVVSTAGIRRRATTAIVA